MERYGAQPVPFPHRHVEGAVERCGPHPHAPGPDPAVTARTCSDADQALRTAFPGGEGWTPAKPPTAPSIAPARYGRAVRRLLPAPADDVDLAEDYGVARRPLPDRPWVVANMIASVDGSAAVHGRTSGLGGPADRLVFHMLRACADVVVAGAATVRTERYRPIREPRPTPIAVISRSLSLDWSMPLFTDAPARTIILTCEAAEPERRRHAAGFADVVVAGGGAVEPALALAALAARGHEVVLCEGGPSLLAQLVEASVLDELCLTVSPLLAGGDGPRIVTGATLVAPTRLSLASALEDDGFLLLRYLIDR